MSAVTINHALGSYPVYVESGMLVHLRELLDERFPRRRLVLITDEKVSHLYDEWTSGTAEARRLGARASDAGVRPSFALRLTFAPGESSKTRATWQRLTDEMLTAGVGRDAVIVALGGGVTGDLAGFVSATYLRGIPYAQVPTTLLAMVDAAVGGKVGVDTPAGKNLVGAFYPPSLVVADPLTLLSLAESEYRAGLAEAIKHGLIADADYLDWIVARGREIQSRQTGAVAHLVLRSVEIKAGVVSEDERELGRRAILNAGHTVAHAMETASGYQMPHGEAVAIGLVTECRIAESAGIGSPGLATRVAGVLERFGLPVRVPRELEPDKILSAMMGDKKNRDGAIHFALPVAVGAMHRAEGGWTIPVSAELIRSALVDGVTHISTSTEVRE
jgi:3-dehydroquinate synthase